MSEGRRGGAARVAHAAWRRIEARRTLRLVLGTVLLGIGLVGLLMPILPGWLLIFVGLAVLGVRFAFVTRMVERARRKGAAKRRP